MQKMSKCNSIEKTYYQKNRDVILTRARDYCANDKETLRNNSTDK